MKITYPVIFTASISFVSCASKEEVKAPPAKPANIIFILADDLGYGDIGAFGQKQIKTPHLDQMAREGMMFTNHYAGSTVCAPSRCALMTGLHTGHARVRGNKDVPLQPADTTVAELLKKAGYETALIGKWGLGENGTTGTPDKKGFDYFVGYLNQIHAHNAYPAYLWKNQDTLYLENEVEIIPETYAKGIGGVAKKKQTHTHDLFTKEALNYISEKKDTSFFLYLAYTLPHANNEAWYWDAIGMEAPDTTLYSDKTWPAAQKAHAAMITALDRDVGTLLKHLKDLGIDRNTLVIFTSDNGPHSEGGADPEFFDSNGPFSGQKRDLTEGGIRVPMIAWWPGKIKAGAENNKVSAFWDILPTACDVAGIPPTAYTDGISLLPALLGEPQIKHRYLYWEFYEQGGKQALRMDNWKAIKLNMNENFDAPIALYNIEVDSLEQNDVSSQYPEVIEAVEQIFKTAHPPSADFRFAFEEE